MLLFRERIAGKDYSFSSDIWGCGLSILAVAMGCYPFSKPVGNKNGGSQKLKSNRRRIDDIKKKEVELDHSGGYWHILQAISQRPSIKDLLGKGHTFSSEFCNFLSLSLHRDKSHRASAAKLLSLAFLGDESTRAMDSNGSIENLSKSALENEALCLFTDQCCTAHREKHAKKLSSSTRFLPSLKSGEIRMSNFIGDYRLQFIKTILGSGQGDNDAIDSNYEYIQYDTDDTDNMNHFFTMLTAYKDFTLTNWELEKVEGGLSCRSRTRALQHLLDTTLSCDLQRPRSLSHKLSQEYVDIIGISPSIAPLFDMSIISNLAEKLNIPIHYVTLCLRDFAIELLSAEGFPHDVAKESSTIARKSGDSATGLSPLISTHSTSDGYDAAGDVNKVRDGHFHDQLSSEHNMRSDDAHERLCNGITCSIDSLSALRIDETGQSSSPKLVGETDLNAIVPDIVGDDYYEDDFDS
jgi:hypothetical protein